jgi:pheromone a factor receptor
MTRLEAVASTRRTMISASARRRRMWFEIFGCIALPLFMLPIVYVVQPYCYTINQSLGPVVKIFPSWPGVVVQFLLPLVVSVTSIVFAGKTISGWTGL